MILVTGATGKLGQHVVSGLLARLPGQPIAVMARDVSKAAALFPKQVVVRSADYDQPATLDAALQGVTKLLLISSSEVGKRAEQHRAVIDAAKRAGVKLIAYTSILRADSSPLLLAQEHRATEDMLRASAIPFVFLRNGWYVENYSEHLAPALEHAALLGSAGEGRIAAATRQDYAAAAVEVLTTEGHANAIYELAGDEPFTMPELADEVSRRAGKAVRYVDLPGEQLKDVLRGAGLPDAFAEVLVNADLGAAKGALDDRSRQLSALIGRPTTPLRDAIASALP